MRVAVVEVLAAGLPVAGRLDPVGIVPTLIHHVVAHRFAHGAFACNKDVAVALRQFQALDGTKQLVEIARFGAFAAQPMDFGIFRCVDLLDFAIVGNLYDGDGTGVARQFLEPAGNGRQRGFIADEQIPVEIAPDNERAARPADADRVAGLCVLRPARSGAITMEHEIERQGACGVVIVARRVVARFGAFAVGKNEPVFPTLGTGKPVAPASGKNTLQ